MVATKPVDFRKGLKGLATLVRESMVQIRSRELSMCCGPSGRTGLSWCSDGTGLCLVAKRREEGVLRWPKIEDGVMRLSAAQIVWRLVHEARETPPPSQPG
ncbi:IS66 family insertion sequence element accessory protein TnpB [Bradyrhizobium sp. ISRA442]|uniref:IS66 family insertion sequence element accessory protein TnpB n=1 Tax=Bradyrhizobium sp. ISRA442 TaxID=2866197 RepID=UPI004049D5A7